MSVGFGFGCDVSPVEEEEAAAAELDCPAVSPFKNLASNILTSSVDCWKFEEKKTKNFVEHKVGVVDGYLLLYFLYFSDFR